MIYGTMFKDRFFDRENVSIRGMNANETGQAVH